MALSMNLSKTPTKDDLVMHKPSMLCIYTSDGFDGCFTAGNTYDFFDVTRSTVQIFTNFPRIPIDEDGYGSDIFIVETEEFVALNTIRIHEGMSSWMGVSDKHEALLSGEYNFPVFVPVDAIPEETMFAFRLSGDVNEFLA